MLHAFATLERNISRAIESMPTAFDTHKLILELAQKNQPDYVRALFESGSETPFQAVHSTIGKSLKRHSLELGIQETVTAANYSSPNIFGVNSSCSKWEKT